MGTPHYEHGQWSDGSDWLDTAWIDGDGLEHDGTGLGTITRLGYRDTGLTLTLYGHAAHIVNPGIPTPPYVIEIGQDVGSIEYVSAGTLPDALDLMGRWAPVVTAAILADLHNELAEPTARGIVCDVLAALEMSGPRVHQRVADQERYQATMRKRHQAAADARGPVGEAGHDAV